jgi:hypothetical protein
MSVEGRRGERALTFGRTLASGRFFGAGAFQLLIVNFHKEIQEPLPDNWNGATLFSPTHQPNALNLAPIAACLFFLLCILKGN